MPNMYLSQSDMIHIVTHAVAKAYFPQIDSPLPRLREVVDREAERIREDLYRVAIFPS